MGGLDGAKLVCNTAQEATQIRVDAVAGRTDTERPDMKPIPNNSTSKARKSKMWGILCHRSATTLQIQLRIPHAHTYH